jgi:hypothetical protein
VDFLEYFSLGTDFVAELEKQINREFHGIFKYHNKKFSKGLGFRVSTDYQISV